MYMSITICLHGYRGWLNNSSVLLHKAVVMDLGVSTRPWVSRAYTLSILPYLLLEDLGSLVLLSDPQQTLKPKSPVICPNREQGSTGTYHSKFLLWAWEEKKTPTRQGRQWVVATPGGEGN